MSTYTEQKTSVPRFLKFGHYLVSDEYNFPVLYGQVIDISGINEEENQDHTKCQPQLATPIPLRSSSSIEKDLVGIYIYIYTDIYIYI
jgi:hypothetical protein